MDKKRKIKVKLLTARSALNGSTPAGSTIELPVEEAKRLIETQQAEQIERAVAPRQRGR